MAKKIKSKVKSSKRSAMPEPQLPTMVEGIAKLVERLESVERKMDQIMGRVSNLPSEIRNAVQQSSRNHSSHQTHSPQPSLAPRFDQGQSNAPRERQVYQAICADCQKSCEVPFKPGNRPVYCKECFAIRKAGHRTQNLEQQPRIKPSYVPSALGPNRIPTIAPVAVLKRGKQKASAKAKPQKKKK